MSSSRRLMPLLPLLLLALAACSTPPPVTPVSASPSAVASASSAPAETPPASSAATWPGVAGELRAHLEASDATCGLIEETESGFNMQCGLQDEPVEYTIRFDADVDGALREMNILAFDMTMGDFADTTETRMQNTVLMLIDPLIGSGNGPAMFSALSTYWSYVGTGTSIVPPGSPVKITFDELGATMPEGSTISLTVTPAEGEAPATDAPASEEPTSGELDYSLESNFGSTDLDAGFTPDPFSIEMISGGPIDVSYLGDECRGYATAASDFEVSYVSGASDLLRFYFVSNRDDTTLIINAPDGSWHCNDDASLTVVNPMIDFANPESGWYDIWVGSYEDGTENSGTLFVTELESNGP